jgi:5-hydroxyisourate hydrolase
MARISTHVLDIALGRPAPGIRIELFHRVSDERRVIGSAATNSDGRTNEPLLAADTIAPGTYELDFHAGGYFRSSSSSHEVAPVFDVITVRFDVADPRGNYHVPLLLAPNGYTTYRGS